jgi:membrane-associated phospholipid phosphatase
MATSYGLCHTCSVLRGDFTLTVPRALLATATLSFAGFLVLAVVAAQDQFLSLDHRARHLVHLARTPSLDPAMRDISQLGDNAGLLPLIVVATALLWRTARRWALVLPPLMAGTGGLQLLAKWAVDRPRPNLAAWGFPSGHVLSLVVFFGLMTYVLCMSTARRRWQCLGSAGCGTTVLAVAFSRLYLEMHWISDVAGGFMLGLAYLLPIIWLVDTFLGSGTTATVNDLVAESGSQLTAVPGQETLSAS